MSEKHPNVNEILANSKGIPEMRRHLEKSYLNLAKMAFNKKHKRLPTIADSQEVYNIYESEWRGYYIDKPAREKENRTKGRSIWHYGIRYKLDVWYALCRFLEYKYSEFFTGARGDKHPVKNAGDLMREMNIEFIESHIIDNNLEEEWRKFIDENKAALNKYHKPNYIDYSHLAYSGVTDDF